MEKKKILILSTGDVRGAYEASYKIAKFLIEAGHEALLLVKYKTKKEDFIVQIPYASSFLKRVINALKNKLGRKSIPNTNPDYCFLDDDENKNYISVDTIMKSVPFKPDMILCGMTDGFVNTNTLVQLKKATNAQIYTWLVDMGPITGGCHYAWDCKGYENDCSNCPAIIDGNKKDWPSKNLATKLKNIKEANIQVLAGSAWVARQASKSTLFKNQKHILNTNNCIDTRLMNNNSRMYAKHIFNFPANSKIIFAGSQHAADPRKGLSYFVDALNILWQKIDERQKEETYVMIVGEHSVKDETIKKIPFKKLVIDYISDYRYLALAYQAADLFVCASIEDSGPMMVSEAMACGTPVVGFEMGSVYTMVENGFNGYRAELKNSAELSECIYKILSLSKEEFEHFSSNAIKQVERKSSHLVAVNVINEILNSNI